MRRAAITIPSTVLLLSGCGDFGFGKEPDTGAWGMSDGYSQDFEDQDPVVTAEDDPKACDEQTPITCWISPDDSNSMASPVMAREAVLGAWDSLNSVSLRTWES